MDVIIHSTDVFTVTLVVVGADLNGSTKDSSADRGVVDKLAEIVEGVVFSGSVGEGGGA